MYKNNKINIKDLQQYTENFHYSSCLIFRLFEKHEEQKGF